MGIKKTTPKVDLNKKWAPWRTRDKCSEAKAEY